MKIQYGSTNGVKTISGFDMGIPYLLSELSDRLIVISLIVLRTIDTLLLRSVPVVGNRLLSAISLRELWPAMGKYHIAGQALFHIIGN